MTDKNPKRHWSFHLLAAIIPLLLGALATIAWQNSHRLTLVEHKLDALQRNLISGETLQLRLDHNEEEIKRLRDLLEQRK